MQYSGLITCAKHYVLYEQEPVCTGPLDSGGGRTECHDVSSEVDGTLRPKTTSRDYICNDNADDDLRQDAQGAVSTKLCRECQGRYRRCHVVNGDKLFYEATMTRAARTISSMGLSHVRIANQ